MRVHVNLRRAVPENIEACAALRGQTCENAISIDQLVAMGITIQSWAEEVESGLLTGYVCVDRASIVGFCFGENASGEVLVLALLPAYENCGIGRRLLRAVVGQLSAQGHKGLFLDCNADPGTRAHGFYRHLGWASTGTFDQRGDEILELFPPLN